jgi:hypothetical protein
LEARSTKLLNGSGEPNLAGRLHGGQLDRVSWKSRSCLACPLNLEVIARFQVSHSKFSATIANIGTATSTAGIMRAMGASVVVYSFVDEGRRLVQNSTAHRDVGPGF